MAAPERGKESEKGVKDIAGNILAAEESHTSLVEGGSMAQDVPSRCRGGGGSDRCELGIGGAGRGVNNVVWGYHWIKGKKGRMRD